MLAKALIVHACSWPETAESWADDLGLTAGQRRSALTDLLGYGRLDATRLASALASRACLIGAGSIKVDKRHSLRFPLPIGLSGRVGPRRLTVTLAWFSPVVPHTQRYRVAELSLISPKDDSNLRVGRVQVDHNKNGNGTVVHEILESDQASPFVDGATVAIDVQCRKRVGSLAGQAIRYGIVVSLEVGEQIGIDVHAEVEALLRTRVAAQAARISGR